METFITAFTTIFAIGIVATPVLIFNDMRKWDHPKMDFWGYFLIAFIMSSVLFTLLYFLLSLLKLLLLYSYGFDIHAAKEAYKMRGVLPTDIPRVQEIRQSLSFENSAMPFGILQWLHYGYSLVVYAIGQKIIRK